MSHDPIVLERLLLFGPGHADSRQLFFLTRLGQCCSWDSQPPTLLQDALLCMRDDICMHGLQAWSTCFGT